MTHNLKVGDTARVARQPINQFAKIEGEIVSILDIQGEYGHVRSRSGGEGSVPLDCLEPYSEGDESGDRCQRCGEVGEDRRTIWMACMYEMTETGLPLKQVRITGKYAEQTGEEVIPGSLKLRVPVFTEGPDTKDHEHRFYTLRCCKDCRSTWMLAIKQWFEQGSNEDLQGRARERVRPGMHQIDGQVPIRVFGATVSVPLSDKSGERTK